jgi:hypothetical protein
MHTSVLTSICEYYYLFLHSLKFPLSLLLGMTAPMYSITIEHVDILYFFSEALTNVFPEIFREDDNNRRGQIRIDLESRNYKHNIPTDFLSLPNHFKNKKFRRDYNSIWFILMLKSV